MILPGESLAKYRHRAPAPTLTPEAKPLEPSAESATPEQAVAPPVEKPAAESEPESAEQAQLSAETSPEEPSGLAAPPVVPEPVVEEPGPESHEEASAARKPEAAAPEKPEAGREEVSLAEAASITETLAEERQEDVLEEEENGEVVKAEEPAAEAAEAEGEPDGEERGEEVREVSAETAETEEPSEPEPGNELTTVRMDRPSRSRFQRPVSRERHRGGRRHRRHRGERNHERAPHHHHAPPRRVQQISDLLKAGQEVIIQITKEPLGKKGARITSHVALPGRFLVYMPTLDHIGISRKIGTAETRGRLRHLVDELRQGHPGGFIARTAAGVASEDDIRADAEYLTRTWQEIRAKSEQRRAPTLLHRDLNLVERLLRDCLNRDFNAVWVDSEEEYTRVVDFVSRFQPDLVNRVKLYTKETPIFEEMGVQQEVDKSLRPKVWLKSGGYIVINHTEALVAIDVNTGKYVGRGSNRLEDTIVKTNIDAVKEIVRQIRLRDLGGIIVVDFIDMEERRNREKVLQALEEALRQDRAPSKVLPFNEFGLVAITRKRTKQALERVLCQPCPYCSGSGMVKSVPTICYEIEAEARKMSGELDTPSITLRVHPEIAKALKTREANLIDELERVTHKNVVIQSDATLHFEQYDIY